ncbi:MAG: hypothetical protein K8T26_03600 [Lentisphaerae bacterium]|nr:hypothetical protein [Lentisphaerota bacterium]
MALKSTESLQGRWLVGDSAEDSYPIHMLAPGSQYREHYASNPRRYFEAGNAVTYACNSLGYRGPEFADGPTGGVLRIAFIGDSNVFGEGVKFQDTVSERLASILNRQTAGAGVRCVGENYAVPGYNAVQNWVTFDQVVWPTRPDVVVLGCSLNDAEGPQFLFDSATGAIRRHDQAWQLFCDQFEALPRWRFVRASRLATLVWQCVNRSRLASALVAHYRELYGPGNPHWAPNRSRAQRLVSACASNGVPLVVVLFPVLEHLDGDYPYGSLHASWREAIEGRLGTNGMLLDLLPVFQGRAGATLWVHPTDSHPNEMANVLEAGELAARIEGSAWFAPLVEQCGRR